MRMKKFYFYSLIACLMFLVAPATAQVSSVADLYGKYNFTATVELLDNSYANQLLEECEVVIDKDVTYNGAIVGFAGSQNPLGINEISVETTRIEIPNPNLPQLWNGLYLANENGDNPYGVWENGTQTVARYGPIYFTYNPNTKEITVPDFTVVTLADYSVASGTIVAKFTNVKMTFVEDLAIEVADISGDWNFKAGSGEYDTMAGSALPTEFGVTLAKSGDDNRNYNATVSVSGINVTLAATFDGDVLSIPFKNTYLTETLRLAPIYGNTTTEGTIDFKSALDETFTLYNGFAIAHDSIGKTKDELSDSTIVVYDQWYGAGVLSRPSSAPEFTWDGTYTVSVAAATDVIVANGDTSVEWPTEFKMEIVYDETTAKYVLKTFLDYDVYTLNQGYIAVTPADDGKSATVALDAYYGCAFLARNEDGTYLQLTNSMGQATTLTLTLNDDGTIGVEDFFIQNLDFNTAAQSPVVFYQNVTAVKEATEEPEQPSTPEAYDWEGEYALTADVTSFDGSTYPSSFYVTVTTLPDANGVDVFLVSSFMGQDISGINYGGLSIVPGDDAKSAELNTGYLFWTEPGVTCLKIRDMNATTSPIALTINEDGTISMATFAVMSGSYGDDSSNILCAVYENVVLVKGGTITEPEQEPVDYTPTNTGTRTYTERNIQAVNLNSALHGAQSYSLTDSEQLQEYLDWTSTENCFVAAPGEEVTVTVTTGGSWVNYYVYIDLDADGFTASIAEGSAWAPAEDLFAYSLYNNGGSSDETGCYNSVGTSISGDNRSNPSIPAFTVPAEVGTYRMRIKQDWCSIDPNGDSNSNFGGTFSNYGGQIIDITFVVTDDTAIENVTEEGVIEGIFDLSGRKLEQITAPGIYIVNGKKVLVK